jgi:hypothetical protein
MDLQRGANDLVAELVLVHGLLFATFAPLR